MAIPMRLGTATDPRVDASIAPLAARIGAMAHEDSRRLLERPIMPPTLSLTPDHRIAGVLIPIFALRSGSDQGIGDTGTLRRFIVWAAESGFALVQLLPINETGGDNSPYNAISSMALDPCTLELTPDVLEDLNEEDYRAELASVDLPALREGPVQYSQVKPLKLRLLRRAYGRFVTQDAPGKSPRGAAFTAFRQHHAAWLENYVVFRALMDENGGTECWDRWPMEQQTPVQAQAWANALPADRLRAFTTAKDFYAYIQWVAYQQWEAIKEFAEEQGVVLMGDIPLGVSYYSVDYFGNPEIFEPGWSGGAPPEPYFKDDPFTQKWGQNWGIPVYNWARMAKNDYAWWRQRVGGVRDLFHVFRIDHILGFYRIYSFPWRPEQNAKFLPLSAEEAKQRTSGRLPQFKPRPDETREEKEANRRDGETFLRMVLEAAGDTCLIGEDLGTVPDYVRPSLTSLGIAGFKIPIWEPNLHAWGLLPGQEYSRLSLATYGTHDHEPLRALWDRWMQSPPDQREELHRLAYFAGIPGDARSDGFTDRVHEKLLAALLQSNSWIAIFMITDLLAREERFNVPGTAAESNWSRRMHVTVEALTDDPEYHRHSSRIRALIREAGREIPGV